MATLAWLIKPSVLSENLASTPMAAANHPIQSTVGSEDAMASNGSVEHLPVPLNQTAAYLVSYKTPSAQFLLHYTMDQMEHSIDLNASFRIVFYFIYFLIFVVGITGNVLVCYVVFRQTSMRTVTNLFIANMGLSDILLCLFCVPFTPLYLLFFKEWIFGSLFCHLVPFAQGRRAQ